MMTLENTGSNLPEILTSKELQEYFRCCRQTAENFGRDCGARIQIGRKVMYDRDIILQAAREKAAR